MVAAGGPLSAVRCRLSAEDLEPSTFFSLPRQLAGLGLVFDFRRGGPESRVQGAGELDVQAVPGLAGADVPGERTAEQGQVSHEIQDLVANELVPDTPARRGERGGV